MRTPGFFSVLFLVLALLASPAVAIIEISSCGTLNVTNEEYVFAGNINDTDAGDCFTVTANNITLDFSGYTLTSIGGNRAVNLESANYFTVANGTIVNFSIGILFDSEVQDFGTVRNMTFVNQTSIAIQIIGPDNLTIRNNTILNVSSVSGTGVRITTDANDVVVDQNFIVTNGSSADAVYVGAGSLRAVVANNTIISNNYGVNIQGGSGHFVYNNTVTTVDRVGIYALAANSTFEQNIVSAPTNFAALQLYGSVAGPCAYNTITGGSLSGLYGIYLSNCTESTAYNVQTNETGAGSWIYLTTSSALQAVNVSGSGDAKYLYGSGSNNLTVMWRAWTNVSWSGNFSPVEGALVNVTDEQGNLVYANLETNASGLTQEMNLTEFIGNLTSNTSYANHTLSAVYGEVSNETSYVVANETGGSRVLVVLLEPPPEPTPEPTPTPTPEPTPTPTPTPAPTPPPLVEGGNQHYYFALFGASVSLALLFIALAGRRWFFLLCGGCVLTAYSFGLLLFGVAVPAGESASENYTLENWSEWYSRLAFTPEWNLTENETGETALLVKVASEKETRTQFRNYESAWVSAGALILSLGGIGCMLAGLVGALNPREEEKA